MNSVDHVSASAGKSQISVDQGRKTSSEAKKEQDGPVRVRESQGRSKPSNKLRREAASTRSACPELAVQEAALGDDNSDTCGMNRWVRNAHPKPRTKPRQNQCKVTFPSPLVLPNNNGSRELATRPHEPFRRRDPQFVLGLAPSRPRKNLVIGSIDGPWGRHRSRGHVVKSVRLKCGESASPALRARRFR
jgi:hypothetical protein